MAQRPTISHVFDQRLALCAGELPLERTGDVPCTGVGYFRIRRPACTSFKKRLARIPQKNRPRSARSAVHDALKHAAWSKHAGAWRRPRTCRFPEVRLHGNRLQASTASVVPRRVPIWLTGMRQQASRSPPTSWRLCAPRSTIRPAVPKFRRVPADATSSNANAAMDLYTILWMRERLHRQ